MTHEEPREALRRKTEQALTDLEKFLGVPARRNRNWAQQKNENSQSDVPKPSDNLTRPR
jgi:hypothetical protein